MSDPVGIIVEYADGNVGRFSVAADDTGAPIWSRLKVMVVSNEVDARITGTTVEMSWPDALNIVREFGSKATQRTLNFRFRPDQSAKSRLQAFAAEVAAVHKNHEAVALIRTPEQINADLLAMGFTKRELKPFQLRDLSRLISLANGANFSVPGAGKTTVTFALHMLVRKAGQKFFVVAPKNAFQAWRDVVDECMEENAPDGGAEPFTVLDGREQETTFALKSGATRLLMSYDLMIRQQGLIASRCSASTRSRSGRGSTTISRAMMCCLLIPERLRRPTG